MRLRGIAVATLVVLLSTIALSYIVLRAFSEVSFIRVGSKRLEMSSLGTSEAVWASLLGLSVMGFSVGSAIAPNNVPLELLLDSYSGDWIFRALIALAVIGAVGGIVVEDPGGATVASALGTLLALSFGGFFTFTVLPSLLEGLGISAGEQSELLSAVAVSQFVGALAASLIAGLTGAVVARMMLQRRIVHVEPLRLPPPPPPDERPYRYCPDCGCDLGEFSPDRSTCPKCGSSIQRP